MTISEAIKLFLNSYFDQSERSHHTRKAYRCDLYQFIDFLGGNPLLTNIQSDSCEAWITQLKTNNASSATRKRKVATLRCFFSELVRRRLIPLSPMQDLRFRFPTGNEIPKALSLADTRQLLQTARETVDFTVIQNVCSVGRPLLGIRNLAMTELLVSTGIRVGELTALTLVDVNINERVLRIHGKGGKERPAFLTDDTTFAALSQYLEIRRRIKLAHERLFVNARSTPLSEQGVAYVLEELGKRATLPLRLTPHMLRHTAATLFLQNGADIRLVQEFLGHSSIITTQRYAHVTRDHLRSALSTLFPGKLLHA